MVGLFTAASAPIWAAGISAAGGLASGLLSNKGGGTMGGMQQTQVDQGLNQAGWDFYNQAVGTADRWLPAYTGQRVADLTPQTKDLISQLYGNVGSTNAGFTNALGGTNALMGFQGQQVTPQMLSSTSLTPYMSPYTASVINPTMNLMENQRQNALNQIGQGASQVGAFGGSRQGVQEGTTNAAYGMNEAQMAGNLWNQNFNQAQAAATGDITRNLTAQQSNQQYAQLAAQLRGQMAGQYGNLTAQQQQNWLTGIQAALGGQGMLTQNQQDQINAAIQQIQDVNQNSLQKLQVRGMGIQGMPQMADRTSYSAQPYPQGNALASGLGAGSTLLGMAGQLGAFNRGNTTSPNTYSYPSPAQNAMYPEFGPINGGAGWTY